MWIFTPKPRPLDVDASHLINNVNFYLIKEGICHIPWLSVHCFVKSFHWQADAFCFLGNEKSENLVLMHVIAKM